MLKVFDWFKKKNKAANQGETDEFKYAVGAILDKFEINCYHSLLFVGELNGSAKWFFSKSGVWADCLRDGENSERVHCLGKRNLSALPKYDYVVFYNDFDCFKQQAADEIVQNLLQEGGRAIFISTDNSLPQNLKLLMPSFAFDVETDGEIKVLSCIKI